MDIKRPPKSKLKKKIRTAVMIVVGVATLGGITYGLTKLKPAAPTLDPSTAVIDTVKRGEMVRDVRGNGTLVPEVTRWVPAPAEGRVETLPLQAGVEVTPDTVIAELSNPQMEQQATDAEFQVKAAEADEENLRVRLESETHDAESRDRDNQLAVQPGETSARRRRSALPTTFGCGAECEDLACGGSGFGQPREG